MKIKQYDHVVLKTGKKALIVEILEEDKTYIADIETQGDYDTETIKIEEIEKVL